MNKKITFTMPEWIYQETIGKFEASNRSDLIQELLYLGTKAKEKLKALNGVITRHLAQIINLHNHIVWD